MNKLKLVILCLLLPCMLTGCSDVDYQNNLASTKTFGGYFTNIKMWKDGSRYLYIVYDNETNVEYLIEDSHYTFGITPLYDASGDVKIYKGE